MALGHLHGAQRVGQEKIRYCGTLLKYSVSEASQKKTLHVVELKEKGSEPEIQNLPLHPLRDVRKLRGTLEEILEAEDGTGSEDYVSVTLTDEVDPYKPKEPVWNLVVLKCGWIMREQDRSWNFLKNRYGSVLRLKHFVISTKRCRGRKCLNKNKRS